MNKINWPPERIIKYEFNSLDKDYIGIKAENGSERPNKSKGKAEKREAREI